MIENYTMGPNSTSLFILTLRESYKLSDSRVILTCCCLQFWIPPTSSHRRTVMSEDMRDEVCLKIYGRLKAGILFLFFNLK